MSALEQHYSVNRAAELTDYKPNTIRKAICKKPGEKGYLASVKTAAGGRRIPRSALMEWLRSDAPSETLAPVVELSERRKK